MAETHIDSIQHSNNTAANQAITNLAGQGQHQNQGQKVKATITPVGQENSNNSGAVCAVPEIRNSNGTRVNTVRKKLNRTVHFDNRNGCVTLPSMMANSSVGGPKRLTSACGNPGYDGNHYDTIPIPQRRDTDAGARLVPSSNGLVLGTKMLRAGQGYSTGSGPVNCRSSGPVISCSDSSLQHSQEPVYDTVDPGDTIYAKAKSRSNLRTEYGGQLRSSPSTHVTRVISNEEVQSDWSGSLPGSVNSHVDEEEELGQGYQEVTEDELVRCCQQAKSMTRSNERLYCKSLPSPIVLPESPGQL